MTGVLEGDKAGILQRLFRGLGNTVDGIGRGLTYRCSIPGLLGVVLILGIYDGATMVG